jgi:hypothetical protein
MATPLFVYRSVDTVKHTSQDRKTPLRNLYASPGTVRVIISRRMRWAGHAARMEKMKNIYKTSSWKVKREETTWKA